MYNEVITTMYAILQQCCTTTVLQRLRNIKEIAKMKLMQQYKSWNNSKEFKKNIESMHNETLQYCNNAMVL